MKHIVINLLLVVCLYEVLSKSERLNYQHVELFLKQKQPAECFQLLGDSILLESPSKNIFNKKIGDAVKITVDVEK